MVHENTGGSLILIVFNINPTAAVYYDHIEICNIIIKVVRYITVRDSLFFPTDVFVGKKLIQEHGEL